MPSPPPASKSRSRIPVSASSRQSSAPRDAAANTGSASSSWEPMWKESPTGSSAASAAARRKASIASARPRPNLLAAPPVVRYSCPPPATSGFSRTAIGATRPSEVAAKAISSSSSRRLDVERADPRLDGRADLVLALADAGEDDPVRRDPRRQGFRELAAGDDVGAEPFGRDHPQDRQRVVGLRRVARQVRDVGERLFERPNPLAEAVEVVGVERRSDLSGDGRELVA